MAQRSRITRVEAVVIGCCVVLALLTLGAVGNAGRRLALEQVCLSNVEVLTQAWLTYANDHNGALVNAFPTGSTGWVWQAKIPWYSPVMPPLEQKLEAIRKGSLFGYVGDLNVYHCPADPRLSDPNQRAFGSFSIAGGANGQDGGGHNYVEARRYADIANPSAKYILVEEPDPRGENFGCWEMHFNSLYWRDAPAMWHEESTTLGFADGHGDVHRWHDRSLIDYSYQESHGPAEAFPFKMTPPAGETRDIEFMRDGFPCKATY
jgi:hypothetical protein